MILTKEYGQYNTKSNSTINVDLFSPGSLSISWDIYHPFINQINLFSGFESPVFTDYEYRVVMPDGRVITCEKEFLYITSDEIEEDAVFLMYYIPTSDDTSFTEAVSDILDNGGNMHDYTGIKIYTTIGGDIIRINQYINGKFIDGLYFPALKSDEEIDSGYHSLISMMGGMTIQKHCSIYTKVNHYGDEQNDDDEAIGWDNEMIIPAICTAQYEVTQPGRLMTEEYFSWIAKVNSIDEQFRKGTIIDANDSDPHAISGRENDDNDCDHTSDDDESIEDILNRIESLIKNDGVSESTIQYLRKSIEDAVNLDSKLTTEVLRSISILESITVTTANLADPKKNHNTTLLSGKEITLMSHLVDNVVSIFEEFFHVLQIQESPLWEKGDYELEAKLYVICLEKELYGDDAHMLFDKKNYDAFIAFYSSPNNYTYTEAVSALRREGYNEGEFPMSNDSKIDFDDRIIHLKKLTANEKSL